jgi:para-nitrobenzyl esterase
MYPARTSAEVGAAADALYSDWSMTCGTRADARDFAAQGVPTYLYRFTWVPETGRRLGVGSYHGAELSYLFDSLFEGGRAAFDPTERELSRQMIARWAAFARTGSPNAAGLTAWPAFQGGNDISFELGARFGAQAGLKRSECDLWDRIGD